MFSLSTAEIRQRLKNKTKDNGCNITRFLQFLHSFQILNLGGGKKRDKFQQSANLSRVIATDRNSAIKPKTFKIYKEEEDEQSRNGHNTTQIYREVREITASLSDHRRRQFWRLHTPSVTGESSRYFSYLLNKGQPATQNFPSFDLFALLPRSEKKTSKNKLQREKKHIHLTDDEIDKKI
jgi:hypothetical protein